MGEFLIFTVLPLVQVPEAFIDSLAHCKQPQYLTVIRIRIVKLINQKDLDVSKRCFTDDCCNMFGLLTNSPLPEVCMISAYRFGNSKKSDKIKNKEQYFLVSAHYKRKCEAKRWRGDKKRLREVLITLRCALCWHYVIHSSSNF